MTPPEEIHEQRLQHLEELRDGRDDHDFDEVVSSFAPGSLGHHELVHTASVVQMMFDQYVLQHAACVLDPALFGHAHAINDMLCQFYQKAATKGVE